MRVYVLNNNRRKNCAGTAIQNITSLTYRYATYPFTDRIHCFMQFVPAGGGGTLDLAGTVNLPDHMRAANPARNTCYMGCSLTIQPTAFEPD
jgi:hypothetical protein